MEGAPINVAFKGRKKSSNGVGWCWFLYSSTKVVVPAHTHTHPFNGPLSGTTQVSRYQKGKTSLGFTEARDSEWLLHQLGHMQVCTSLQADNHASTPSISFYRPDALPATQPTASKHWRHNCTSSGISKIVLCENWQWRTSVQLVPGIPSARS